MTHLISYHEAGYQPDITQSTLNWRALLAIVLNLAAWAGVVLAVRAVL